MGGPTGTEGRVGRVIRDYESPYRDPVVVRAGETLTVGDRTTDWEGWIWCTTRKGKSRWFPASFLEDTGDLVTLLRDYEATELSVRVGQELILGEEVAGWVWCTNQEGRSGWVPADHLEKP